MRPIFLKKVVEYDTCESYEQCTRLIEKNIFVGKRAKHTSQTETKTHDKHIYTQKFPPPPQKKKKNLSKV